MNEFKITFNRGNTYQLDIVQKNMVSAIALFDATYGNKGLSKIDDKGVSASNHVFIETIPGIEYELDD
jgi:hypothetical protein